MKTESLTPEKTINEVLKLLDENMLVRKVEVYVQPDVPVVPISMLHLMPRPEKVQENSEMGGKDGWQDKEKPYTFV